MKHTKWGYVSPTEIKIFSNLDKHFNNKNKQDVTKQKVRPFSMHKNKETKGRHGDM